MAKLALGKGLDALIPVTKVDPEPSGYLMVSLDKVERRQSQPRQRFPEESIRELADSIRENGILQPLLVRRVNGNFELVAGERRYRAAKVAGLQQVPAVIMNDLDDRESFRLALVENIQREDLTPIEEAEAYRSLIEDGNLTKEELASRIGKNRSTISNSLRLLALPDKIKDMLEAGQISSGHARSLLSIEEESEQLRVAEMIAESNMSVRSIENLIYGRKARRKRGRSLKLKRLPPEIYQAETMLKQRLQTAVRVKRSLKGGRIEIEFYSEDDLSRILDLIFQSEGSMLRST
jgi:ParB family chromosome partitioning protein